MISNGEIRFAAATGSVVAVAAFGSGAPNFQPAMIIVAAATKQIAAIRVILRIANLLPRPESACRGDGKREFYFPECGERRTLQAQASRPMAARNTTPKNCAAMSSGRQDVQKVLHRPLISD
jgi:hypothetical protein